MKRGLITAIAAAVLMASLSGCLPSDRSGEPTSATTTEKGEAVESELTWQEAKARTLSMQLEIARLIPENKVVKINDKKTGTLLSCSKTDHNWNGSTTVTLVEGVDEESVVRAIETHYKESRFNIKTGPDVVGDYRVQLRSPDTAENYIIGKDGPGEVRIASGSACFTLPEGVYPGGDF
jgi:hypothetical protein